MKIRFKDKPRRPIGGEDRERTVFFWFPWYCENEMRKNRIFIWCEKVRVKEIYRGYHKEWELFKIEDNYSPLCGGLGRFISRLLPTVSNDSN